MPHPQVTSQPELTLSSLKKNTGLNLAVPQLVRRSKSGRYVVRFRVRGASSAVVSIGLQTTKRIEAVIRMNELSATAKAFLLDNPEATSIELNAHLKSMALMFLTDKVDSYWSSLEFDYIGDTKADLKSLSLGALSVDQQRHIVKAIKLLEAAQTRADAGDTEPLLDFLKGLEVVEDSDNLIKGSHIGNATAILKVEQGDNPKEFKQERLEWSQLSAIYQNEHSVNLKPASQRDIQSAHKTLSRFVKDIDWKTYTRAEVTAVRDDMRASGLADSTVNKLLAKLCAVMNWANQNGYVPHDYTKGLKVKGVESSRRAFTREELAKVVQTVALERETHKRLFGQLSVVTGARCGELTQLTRADVITEAGLVCIDINANNGKSLKTKASARLVPITEAYGLSIKEFTDYIRKLPSDDSLVFGMSRDVASKWFNEVVLPKALPERTKDLVLHSLRHTMATFMKQAGCAESIAQDVLGHSNQSITFGLYGRAKSVEQMAEALEQSL